MHLEIITKELLPLVNHFLSQAIRSNATGHIVSAIAVPVHNAMNGSLSGIWIGALNLKDIGQILHDQVPNTEIVTYVDQKGQKVVSSDENKVLFSFQ